MSTQTRSGGGGGGGGGNSRSQKKSNSANAGGGTGHDAAPHSAANKKGDANKTDKPEKAQPKATTEQLRIAQITNSTTEDPQINEKVTLLLTMTQRSEEEVCCALNECDYDLEAAANFLIEELPQGAFAKYEKKRKRPASTTADGAAGEGEWADGNANADKRENTRNRSSNRGGGRGGTDSRGWRGRETRENERNTRESRGGGGERGGERGDDRANENYRGQRNGGRSAPGGGGGRGGGFVSRSGRGGGRMGGRSSGPRGDRASGSGGFGAGRSSNANEDHHEVELWDNTIAQNAEKQQPGHDDAWGDWNNEEYEGSLKDSKVFTTSNLSTQTAANVVSGGGAGTGAASGTGSGGELSAPPGLEHHLGSSALAQQGSHLGALVSSVAVGTSGEDNSGSSGPPATPPSALSGSATTPLLQYSAAVSNPPPQMQSQGTQHSSGGGTAAGGGGSASSSFVSAASDTFTSAASAAATLVQQAQQQQQLQQQQTTPIKPSATLSVEQSQYFNSLASQGVSPGSTAVQPTPTGYAPSSTTAYSQTSTSGGVGVGVSVGGSQYPSTYANVFGSAAGDQSQQQTQVRRARVKLPPPSKIPATAVEMPGDNALNNIGYLDVQFGALDFGTDDSFDAMPEKFNAGVEQQQQDDYQNKSQQQQQQSTLTAGLQSSQIGDALSAAGYAARSTAQQQQQSGSSAVASNALDQLTKNDPYGQASSAGNAYQNAYQSSTASKANSAYQTQGGYGGSSYANVQSSVANSYQPQSYGSYQPNVNSYQQQQQTVAGAQSSAGGVPGSGQAATQNIPVGGSASQNSSSGNASSAYLTSGYSTPQSAYQSSQSVYGNSSGFAGSASNASSQYASFSASAKLKDASTASGATHYDSVSTSSGVSSSSGSTGNGAAGVVSGQPGVNQASVSNNNNVSGSNSNSNVTAGVTSGNVAGGGVSQSGVSSGGVGVAGVSGSASSVGVNMNNNNAGSVGGAAAAAQTAAGTAAVLASLTNKNSSSSNSSGSGGGGGATTAGGASTGSGGGGAGSGAGSGGGGGSGSGLVPTNIQMVSQYIQTGLPYYQQPVYSYEELQMMQQRVPHVQGYYDLNYTPTSLGAGRDNLGSVAYSTMTDGRFARTDNNSSPVSNVSSTMSQQAGSSAPMLNVPYAYFYGGNVMPGGFQYGTPAIYPQQIPTANTASGGQFPKPSYSAGYGSTNYDTLSQTTQDYSKGGYSSSVNQQTKTQTVSNQPQAGTASDLTSSMYGKGHVALNKVNSYEKQSFHSGTPPPFNMANTQTAGGTSAQPYGMYLPMPAAGHHNMIHQPIHQMDGRIHSSSRRDSNSAGPRQQSSSQSKSAGKQGYSPSYWTGQN
ncbi:protein lingerer isoform X1 [Drosophila subobscura]|uniref:protein lingerer isoform X1 n=1 Tax=Drosophila subobscura TaxID=7241 RepID=UPI00155A28C8|nr:protein lingerer isoform X1 [Drosophila subobscura]